jgi:hypothetical protein
MISRAGTIRIAFQYIGLIPQIKNAEDAYATPIIVRDSRLGFVFWDLIDFILQAPYFSAITASIDFLMRLKRDLTLKYESPIYPNSSGFI